MTEFNHYPKCADCGSEIFETRVYQCFTCPNEVCVNCVEMAGAHDLCGKCACTDFIYTPDPNNNIVNIN